LDVTLQLTSLFLSPLIPPHLDASMMCGTFYTSLRSP